MGRPFERADASEVLGLARASGLLARLLRLAHDEDLGGFAGAPFRGDLTAAACAQDTAGAQNTTGAEPAHLRARVVARGSGVVCGLALLPDLLEVFAPRTRASALAHDGDAITPGAHLALLEGPAGEVVGVERTLLNLVGRLSGVATTTSAFVRALDNPRVALVDTRKTTPGLRVLEKYAVVCGGGRSHRMGLYDALLLKDNHLAHLRPEELAPFVQRAVARARELSKGNLLFAQAEVDSTEQCEALCGLPAGVLDMLLLDNMPPETLRACVALRDRLAPHLLLEASGGVNLSTIHAIGRTGVDRISVGALTHSAVQLDVGLDADTPHAELAEQAGRGRA